MYIKNEIQVFVSCPGDVEKEKGIVELVCKTLNESAENICNVSFKVREWRSIIGQHGPGMQTIINETIKDYDIYLGIWWMKFGSKTGNVNPSTGHAFESGSEEEFYIAYQNWKDSKAPNIYLFFRKPKAPTTTEAAQQVSRVLKFKDNQEKNGWVNSFNTPSGEFQRNVFQILNKYLLQYCIGERTRKKQELFENTLAVDVEEFRIEYSMHADYVPRHLIDYRSVLDQSSISFSTLPPIELFSLVDSQKRIVLLGDAGSGKSTELKHLAYRFSDKKSPYFPIYQQLNTYIPEIGLENFLPEIWKKIPEELLLIIWDGLDEIHSQSFNIVIKQILNFCEKHSQITFVISCRTNFYELPTGNYTGTLNKFLPYLIKDLSLHDIKKYYFDNEKLALEFIQIAYRERLDDLLKNPFFLGLLLKLYKSNPTLKIKRTEILDAFLESAIEVDKEHFKYEDNIKEKRKDIIKILGKIALGMEILGRNFISDAELNELISTTEFSYIKYSSAFKKKIGNEVTWQFEHNNIQEYLAARVLSQASLETILQFVSYESDVKKIIPSWVNTLTFLFTILDPNSILFQKLMDWILQNDMEVVVKFEREKIPENVRISIFQNIFNYYKQFDVWIRSNKFSEKDLSRFGQSEKNIQFLLDELEDSSNSRTIKLNAIELLRYFEHTNDQLLQRTKDVLILQLNSDENDADYIYSIINVIGRIGKEDKILVELIMEKFKERKNQYIRTAIYTLLSETNTVEKYLDYILEGYNILLNHESGDRGSTSFYNEELELKETIESVISVKALKKLIDFAIENSLKNEIVINDLIEQVVKNSIMIYENDTSIYDKILFWYKKEIHQSYDHNFEKIIKFFDETDTREQALFDVWNIPLEKLDDKFKTIASLLTGNTIEFIIDKYNCHDLTNTELLTIWSETQWINQGISQSLINRIQEKTNIQIPKDESPDYTNIRARKIQSEFNTLFDFEKFKHDTLKVFDDEGKEELTFDELFDIRRENYKYTNLEDKYSGIALRLLRDSTNKGSSISRNKVVEWFNKYAKTGLYIVGQIHEYLSNNKELNVSQEQKDWIANWATGQLNKIDFKKALTINGSRTTFCRLEMYIWYFKRKLDIKLPENIMLDMLSFYYFDCHEMANNDFLIAVLPESQVKERTIHNINEGIASDVILKYHVEYIVNKKLSIAYPYVRKEIINPYREDYVRVDLLNIYFTGTNDILGLKELLLDADLTIKRHIIGKLIDIKETKFVESYLLDKLRTSDSNEEKFQSSQYLIRIQNTEGLEFYVRWIMQNADAFDLSVSNPLYTLKTIEAIQYLIPLLRLSYDGKFKDDSFHNANSIILGAFHNIAFESESNFLTVKNTLKEFLDKHFGHYKNVNYLVHTINQMEDQFYQNRVKSYSIEGIAEKLKLLFSK